MLKTLLYSVCLSYCSITSAITSEITHQTTLLEHVTNFDFHQITLFASTTAITKKNTLLQKIILNNPTVVIDFDSLQSINNLSRISSMINLPRSSNLLVIIQDHFDAPDVKLVLHTYVQLSPSRRRPRCLIIFDKDFESEEYIQLTLQYAWTKKFLDVTILNLQSQNSSTFYYNPFTKIYAHHEFMISTQIFPDKLTDMNKYLLNLPYADVPPYLYKQKVFETVVYKGIEYDLWSLLKSSLNFKTNFIETNQPLDLSESQDEVRNSKFDSSFGFSIISNYSNIHEFEIGNNILLRECYGVLRIKDNNRINFSITVLIVFTAGTFFVIYLFSCSFFTKKYFNAFENFRLMMGQSITKKPCTVTGRFIFLFFAIFSLFFTSDLIAQITESLVSRQEESISTYEDVINAGLQPYGSKTLLGTRYDDEFVEEIRKKTIPSSIYECIKLVLEKEHIICFLPEEVAKNFVKMYRRRDGYSSFKITDIVFPTIGQTRYYAPGSPFVEKFETIRQKLFESGMVQKFRRFHLSHLAYFDDSKMLEDGSIDIVIMIQLLSVYVVGCALSCLVFVLELLVKKLKSFEDVSYFD